MTFSQRLYEKRILIPISLEMLAECIGARLSKLSDYERQYRIPSLHTAARLAKLVGIDDPLRAFNTIDGKPKLFRGDLREDNKGRTSLYPHDKLPHYPDSTKLHRQTAELFRDMMLAEMGRKGIRGGFLMARAKISNQRYAMMVNGTPKVSLSCVANVAELLGMDITLQEFATPEIVPLVPVSRVN